MKKIFALSLALLVCLVSDVWAVSIDTVTVHECYVGETYEFGEDIESRRPIAYIVASNLGSSYSFIEWSVHDNNYNMPPGIEYRYGGRECHLYGAPTQAGVYHMRVDIDIYNRDSDIMAYDYKFFDLTVSPAIPHITTTSPNEGTTGMNYSYELHADVYSNDISGITWEKVSGDLPGGLSLDKGTGIISGIPKGTGDFNFTVKAVNTVTARAQVNYTLTSVDLTTDSEPQELTITVKASGSSPVPQSPTGTTEPENPEAPADTRDPENPAQGTEPEVQEDTEQTGTSGGSGSGGGCDFGTGIYGLVLAGVVLLPKRR